MSQDSSRDASQVHPTPAKPKKSRSCDECVRKKARCEVDEISQDVKCKRCIAHRIECTYATTRKRKASTTTRVQQLEKREQILQTLLKQFLPKVDLSGNFDVDEVASLMSLPQAWEMDLLQYCRSAAEDWGWEKNDENDKPTDIDTTPAFLRRRYFGESSSPEMILKFLLAWKSQQQNTGGNAESAGRHEVRDNRFESTALPWEAKLHSPHVQILDSISFPDHDLMDSLIVLYFDSVNLFMPLLHRPTFDANVEIGLHLSDMSFARVVLLICAIGARFSSDHRVLCDGVQSTLSSGWKWFNQAMSLEERVLAPASLYNVQSCCLGAEFLRGAGATSAFWIMVGIGLRRAQDVGVHRWQTFGQDKSVERELWIRAWWCLVVMDRTASAAIGQITSASYSYDFDVGLPTECDDEFWMHPDSRQDWKQPEGVPSKVSFFISHIKQSAILAAALEYQYATHKAKMLYLFQDLDRKLVMELDSAVNKWMDSIPEHLRDPRDQRNSIFHRQSIVLHAELYALQILMHRPFLAGTDKLSALSSIAICTNAARACSRLFYPQFSDSQNVVYRIQWPIFSAAVVLLMSVWSSKRTPVEGSHLKQMYNVQNCIAMLRYSERCWQLSGQLVDMILSLVSASDLTLPPSQPSTGLHSVTNPLHPFARDDSVFVPQAEHSSSSTSSDGRPLYNSQAYDPFTLNVSSDGASTSTWPFNKEFGCTTETMALSTTLTQDPALPHVLPYSSYPEPLGVIPALIPDILDIDKLDVWTKAPLGLSVEEWKAYAEHVHTTGPMHVP